MLPEGFGDTVAARDWRSGHQPVLVTESGQSTTIPSGGCQVNVRWMSVRDQLGEPVTWGLSAPSLPTTPEDLLRDSQ